MTIARRSLLQAGAAILGETTLAGAARAQKAPGNRGTFEFMVKDLVYQQHGGKQRLARLYQPAGNGTFPAVIQVHGGAWNEKDRTDGQNTSLNLAAAGIVVLAIDFRNAPEAPYPASLQDINYGVRWLKAYAGEFGSSAERVGIYGTSSGGHLALLAAMRPDDARYRALQLAEAPEMDARVTFVISGWGVLFPRDRYERAKAKGKLDLVKSHDTSFRDEATQIEATPALALERGEETYLPPALIFQGTNDEWTPVELNERLAADYRKAGGSMDLLLLEGERHTFLNEHPFAPNSVKTMKAMEAFIKKHGSASQAAR